MNRDKIIDALDKATTTSAKKLKFVEVATGDWLWCGYSIKGNSQGLGYDLRDPQGNVIGRYLSAFVTAAIADALSRNDQESAKKFMHLNQRSEKLYQDMQFYKNAKKWDLYENADLEYGDIIRAANKYIEYYESLDK